MTWTIPRSGQAPLAFEGKQLALSNGDPTHKLWHDVQVYEVEGGGYVARIAFDHTRDLRWETPHNDARRFQSLADLTAWLTKEHDPTACVHGYAPGSSNYRTRQDALMAAVRARFAEQVADVLLQLGVEASE